MPCQFAQDWTIGNLRDMTLAEATRELFKLAEGETTGACSAGNCDYVQICRGCRTKAWHEFGDPFAEDTTCILHATVGERRPLADRIGAAPNPAAPCGGPVCG